MGDTSYIAELILTEKGKPTLLTPYLMSKCENKTLARAYLSANQTSVADAGYVKVNLNTESFDIGGNFNTTTYKYVTPVAGYYQVNYGVYIVNAGVQIKQCFATLYVDGSAVQRGTVFYGNTTLIQHFLSQGSDLIYVAAAKDIELYGLVDTADSSTSTFSSGAYASFLSVHLIST